MLLISKNPHPTPNKIRYDTAAYSDPALPTPKMAGTMNDMPIALTASVDVTPPPTAASAGEAVEARDTISSAQNDEFAEGGAVRAALRLLASVFTLPGGVSIKGGRPDQAATQLGTATLVDPSTGLVRLTLPPDAIVPT